jgi:hypothetical protein
MTDVEPPLKPACCEPRHKKLCVLLAAQQKSTKADMYDSPASKCHSDDADNEADDVSTTASSHGSPPRRDAEWTLGFTSMPFGVVAVVKACAWEWVERCVVLIFAKHCSGRELS